jgi:hypothetical protein
VVASASTKIACPATVAGPLKMYVSFRQPDISLRSIKSDCETAHFSDRVIHESMTSVKSTARRHTKISSSGATRIWPVRSLVNLAKRVA